MLVQVVELLVRKLVGQAMKTIKGKGNPVHVNELLKKKLADQYISLIYNKQSPR
jgi:Asp-tRNA(Asn)/Glu-tRNA(Gln) amidotransferase B subunit